jgi:tetratricopeptide (TPR) repeat protein
MKNSKKKFFFDLKSYELLYESLPKEQADRIKKIATDILVHNKTMKESLKVSDQQLEALYTIGYSRFKLYQFEEAKCFFQLLSLIDHHEPKYKLGIAACYRMSGDIERAIIMYQALIHQNPKYIDAYINLAECFFRTEDWESLEEIFALIDLYIDIQPLNRFNVVRYQTLRSKYAIRADQDMKKTVAN